LRRYVYVRSGWDTDERDIDQGPPGELAALADHVPVDPGGRPHPGEPVRRRGTGQGDTQTAALNARLKRIDNAQNSKILELEELLSDTAAAAMRARIRARFAELHTERQQIETQLRALEKTTPAAADPTLLDQLPLPGDIFNDLPAATKIRLFQAFDLHIHWNKTGQQATVHIEITEPRSKPSPPSSTPPKTATTTPPSPPHRPSAQHPWGPARWTVEPVGSGAARHLLAGFGGFWAWIKS
jgi:hypothetical protein